MAFGSFDRKTGNQPMAEINMVPLIDVVLVLLVIFIVTAPLLTHTVKLDLPKTTSNADIQKPEKIEFAIDARPTVEAPDDDPYLWLEEVEGGRAAAWIEQQNARTLAAFGGPRV